MAKLLYISSFFSIFHVHLWVIWKLRKSMHKRRFLLKNWHVSIGSPGALFSVFPSREGEADGETGGGAGCGTTASG